MARLKLINTLFAWFQETLQGRYMIAVIVVSQTDMYGYMSIILGPVLFSNVLNLAHLTSCKGAQIMVSGICLERSNSLKMTTCVANSQFVKHFCQNFIFLQKYHQVVLDNCTKTKQNRLNVITLLFSFNFVTHYTFI